MMRRCAATPARPLPAPVRTLTGRVVPRSTRPAAGAPRQRAPTLVVAAAQREGPTPAPAPPAAPLLALSVRVGQVRCGRCSARADEARDGGLAGVAAVPPTGLPFFLPPPFLSPPPSSLQALLALARSLASTLASRVVTTTVIVSTVVAAPVVAAVAPGFRAALAACDDAGASCEARWRALVRWIGPAFLKRGGDDDAPQDRPAAATRALFTATLAGAPAADVRAAEDEMRAAVFAALLADG